MFVCQAPSRSFAGYVTLRLAFHVCKPPHLEHCKASRFPVEMHAMHVGKPKSSGTNPTKKDAPVEAGSSITTIQKDLQLQKKQKHHQLIYIDKRSLLSTKLPNPKTTLTILYTLLPKAYYLPTYTNTAHPSYWQCPFGEDPLRGLAEELPLRQDVAELQQMSWRLGAQPSEASDVSRTCLEGMDRWLSL